MIQKIAFGWKLWLSPSLTSNQTLRRGLGTKIALCLGHQKSFICPCPPPEEVICYISRHQHEIFRVHYLDYKISDLLHSPNHILICTLLVQLLKQALFILCFFPLFVGPCCGMYVPSLNAIWNDIFYYIYGCQWRSPNRGYIIIRHKEHMCQIWTKCNQ